MDIFDFAIQMEQEGKELYLELSEKGGNEGIKKIFKMLASEEEKHTEIVRAMRESTPEVAETGILSEARNVFAEIREKGEKVETSGPQADLYRTALDIEDRSIKFYTEKAGEEKAPERKKIFEALAGEEKKHFFLLNNMLEFISRPQTWLENAEFNHLEEY
jgi:rubrerythrin